MTPARLRILTDGLTALAQVIISARSDRDAASIVTQIRSWGPVPRSDVDAVWSERMRELRADEPTQSGPLDEGD